MDRTSYPFNNAAPVRHKSGQHNEKETFAINKFPVSGAGQPLHSLSLSLKDKQFAESW